MALRPLVFGARFRNGERTLHVRAHARDPGRYVVEETRRKRSPRRRTHGSLGEALRDFAARWRGRLH